MLHFICIVGLETAVSLSLDTCQNEKDSGVHSERQLGLRCRLILSLRISSCDGGVTRSLICTGAGRSKLGDKLQDSARDH